MKKSKQKNNIEKETKNKLMIAAASVCLLTGLYGASVMADSESSRGNHEALVEILANKFNLDESEVEKTFKEHQLANRSERQSEMKSRLEEKLKQAVTDGKITDKQKNLILAKREEMQNKISQDVENWSGDSEERRQQMEEYRIEMKDWAEENSINTSAVGLNFGGKQGGRGAGNGMGRK